MSGNRNKEAAQWFYTMIQRQTPTAGNQEDSGAVYRDEAIRPRVQPPAEKLPSLLWAARSLENQNFGFLQSREIVFIKQAKLLANYEDDYTYSGNVVRYYPTYQSLTDQELRGYFSWRTKLRRGEVQQAPATFAFLYIYELLNQIGVEDPMEGYRKLKAFEADYVQLDGTVLPYLKRWLFDYVLYYNLPAELLLESEQAAFDRNLLVLDNIGQYDTPRILEAVKYFAPRWLGRSRFYAQHPQDMDTVIAGVLRGIHDHHAARCKKTMVEQYFGPRRLQQISLFDTAVFLNKTRGEDREVILDPLCVYRCRRGLWSAEKYSISSRSNPKLEDLMKTVDSVMREMYHDRHPVKAALDTKWMLKLIEEQVRALLDGKQAAEAKKLHLDYGKGRFRHARTVRSLCPYPGQAHCGRGRGLLRRTGASAFPGAGHRPVCRGGSRHSPYTAGMPLFKVPALWRRPELGPAGGAASFCACGQHKRKAVRLLPGHRPHP